jgi:hypothetical protein
MRRAVAHYFVNFKACMHECRVTYAGMPRIAPAYTSCICLQGSRPAPVHRTRTDPIRAAPGTRYS